MLYRIFEIEKIFPNWYSSDFPMTYDDQKWIWEHTELNPEPQVSTNKKSVIESESVIGGYKLRENLEKTSDKNTAYALLRGCTYKTAPKVIATYLKTIFGDWSPKPSHWLFIAQRYTPKSINSVVSEMVKHANRGDNTFQTPGAYFTKLIKFHHLRKAFRSSVKGPVTNLAKGSDYNQG